MSAGSMGEVARVAYGIWPHKAVGLGYMGFSVPREPVSWFVGSAETRDVFCSCRHIAVNSPVGGLVNGGWLATDSVAVG